MEDLSLDLVGILVKTFGKLSHWQVSPGRSEWPIISRPGLDGFRARMCIEQF